MSGTRADGEHVEGDQGRHPRSRPGHPLPPRHEGDAEGDAPGRRQAGHPVRRRGGGRGRPRRRPHGHRPQQACRWRTTSTAPTSSSRPSRPRATSTKLAQVRASADLATVHYVRQGDPLGLGHAVLCAELHVGDEPFAVLLGDDLIDPRDPLLPTHDRRPHRARRHRCSRSWRSRSSRSTCTAAPRSSPPTRGRPPGHRPGREAVGRGGAQHLRRHRPLRARPVDLHAPCTRRRRARAARSSSPTP